MNPSHVLEVAIFTVKAGYQDEIPALRVGLREALKGFAGLLEFCGYSPVDDGQTFADIAKWDTLESATAAADAFAAGDPRFAPYMHAIDSLVFMGHFSPEPAI
jgi:heme-degrading monooxygenase HmoA